MKNSSWYGEDKHLPDKELLQERINQSLSDVHADVDRSIGADVERIIDPEAMEAKLAGLTKTVTLSREPNHVTRRQRGVLSPRQDGPVATRMIEVVAVLRGS